jgi:hypothetical protein
MNTAQLTDRAQAVIAASDEYTAPIFRAPSVGGSGKTEAALRRLLAAFPEGNEEEHDADCMCVYHEAVKALAATGETS